MRRIHVFSLYQKIVATFDFVIVTALYTICILYSHIKITHVYRPKKEVYRGTVMCSTIKNQCILYFAREGVWVKAICK